MRVVAGAPSAAVYQTSADGFAVAGTFLAGFVLLPLLGAKRSTLLAAGMNVSLGILALAFSRSRSLAALASRSATGVNQPMPDSPIAACSAERRVK